MKRAFTLAEILITLSIIGVIASMTIPSLVQDIQDAQIKTALRKAYSDLDQATKRVMLENGGNLKKLCSDGNHNCLRNKYRAYLNYTKSCDVDQSYSNCWPEQYLYLNKDSVPTMYNRASLVLNSGYLLMFGMHYYNCDFPTNQNKCGYIWVDVNGFKGPNIFGKDIFSFHIQEKGILPSGSNNDGEICDPTATGTGCTSKYLYQ